MQSLLALAATSTVPQGACMACVPSGGWIGIGALAIAALGTVATALALGVLIHRRRDLAFRNVYACFAIAALAAALSEAAAIWMLWEPVSQVFTALAIVAALISLAGAGALWWLVPTILKLASAEALRVTNEELRAQIDRREQAETALLQAQRLESVGQLTSGVAHDFNNLLQAVAGNLELIARKPDDADRVVRWSASALNAVERGRALTGQLLAFSRKQRRETTSVRLVELIGDVKELVDRAVAPLGQVRIQPIDPSLNVEVDPLQLELAVLNLAFNARDAMPEGGTLTISAARRRAPGEPGLPEGDYVALTIADTGVGMSAEIRARATEAFFTTKGEGTGMGLAMVANALRDSGGGMQIESEPGQGTRVTLFLRVARLEPRREVEDDARSDARIDLRGCAIALIDDDAEVRATLGEVLRGAGAEVREASDGAEGLALVEAERPDLVIVDFGMPGMSGVEVARALHETRPGLGVLVVTGGDSPKLGTVAGLRLAVLRKPFESQELLGRVAEMLGR